MIENIKRFSLDEDGLAVVEYTVAAGLIVAGFVGLIATFRDTLTAQFASIFS
ncbi:Flp family type IVb pilin [Vibrio tetraodonis]|uniref:Flp family type IVb pilin n=1 Tax=Vibrio tetraodonis TaxID=2231647 RepID=UPI0019286C1B|nr:hypothetical protein [Vibrio tetraodonis]